MKTKLSTICYLLSAFCFLLSPICHSAFAQGTAFTYQGQLNDGGSAANGTYDLRFMLFSVSGGGGAIALPLTNSATEISNGLFTVTLDFGNLFPGPGRWLEIGVRTNGGGAFTNLSPRQKFTPTPYAITASNLSGTLPTAQLSGTLASGQLSGTYSSAVTLNNAANSFTGNGAALTSLNASQLTSGTVPSAALANAWKISGNTNTVPGTHFLGTTDNQPLEFRVNSVRVLRLESTAGVPNLIGGFDGNFVMAPTVGATIGGGGAINSTNAIYFASYSTIAGGNANTIGINSPFSTIAGGEHNIIGTESSDSAIGGGIGNNTSTDSDGATIAGGGANAIGSLSHYSAIGGGVNNHISTDSDGATIAGGDAIDIGAQSHFSAIGGGHSNKIGASSQLATIPGGDRNFATNRAFAAGTRAKANHTGAFVWADWQDVDFSSTSNNQFLIRASGGVAIGTNDPAGAALRVAGGIKADSFMGAGTTLMLGTTDNQALELKVNGARVLRLEDNGDGNDGGTLSDGAPNVIGGSPGNAVTAGVVGATISGGGATNYANVIRTNGILSDYATIGGGLGNHVASNSFAGTIAGGYANNIRGNSPSCAIGGGESNKVAGDWSTIAGGQINDVGSDWGTIAGGQANEIGGNSPWGTIGGGSTNAMSLAPAGTIAGGNANTIEPFASYAAIGGGNRNTIEGFTSASTIAGGTSNNIRLESSYSVIGGGNSNTVIVSSGWPLAGYATIPGGNRNTATDYAFAAGNRAKAIHRGSFVWADSTDADYSSTVSNQFLIRASGGVGIGVAKPLHDLHVGTSLGTNAFNASPNVIAIENAVENGRAAFLALAGIGGPDTTNRVEVQIEANENTRRGIIGTTTEHPVYYRVGNSDVMVMATNRFVGINETDPQAPLHVKANADGANASGIRLETAASNTNYWNVGIWNSDLTFFHSSGSYGFINFENGTFGSSSDGRLKKNIEPLSSMLNKALALRPVSYRFKTQCDDAPVSFGFIAQEVETIFPNLVSEKEGYKGLSYDSFIPVAFGAIQELHRAAEKRANEIHALRQQNEELESQNTNLEKRLSDLEQQVRQLSKNQRTH